MDKTYSFDEFMDIIRKLRSKEGCPWDREQTHESLKQCLIEECYEVIEAINNKDRSNLCEELGDLLLQVAMHSVIAEENDEFTIEDVVTEESNKMIHRHPHVFGHGEAKSSEEVLRIWEDIKSKERGTPDPENELRRIPKSLPANIRAAKVQKKAVKLGLELGGVNRAVKDVEEAIERLKGAIISGENTGISDEFGSIMLNMIKLSLVLQINAENSLTNATNEFINRLIDILYPLEGDGSNLYDFANTEQEALWRN
ncbi:MAG: nucleoside triphosphate pyrophosphohydrolase [Clostridiales bacterium]|nr:nucleoside triphosphate pyrophosphohydrolase [Clostridiales bacterium]